MPLLAALPDDVATDEQDDREREVEEDLEALILQRLLHLDRGAVSEELRGPLGHG